MSSTFESLIEKKHLLRHPFYQAWMNGELSQADLKDYAQQYYHHVKAFPRYLSSAHSLCENPEERRALFENLADEEGLRDGIPHPELWARFAEGLGVERESLEAAVPREAIKKVAGTFLRFTRSSYHEALGALYAYESQVPEIAESKIEGLKTQYHIEDPRTLSFFEVHRVADLYHRATIRQQLENLPANLKKEALQAAEEASQVLWDFLSDVQKQRGLSHDEFSAH